MDSAHVLVLLMALASAACQVLNPGSLEYQLLELTDQLKPANGSRYRLPTAVVPLKYNIRLVPSLANFTFRGQVDITVEAVEPVQKITFHVSQLKLDGKSITVKELSAPNAAVEVTSVAEDKEVDFYTLHLASGLKTNTSYVIGIQQFTGVLKDEMVGFYRSKYLKDHTYRWLATTQFEATHARRAFPCFDEPALKARFTISISRSEGLRAISNMPQKGQPQRDTEHTDVVRYWDHFEETPLMSTYLVAFVVSDFEYLDEEMRIFAPPSQVKHTRYALSQSKAILDWLADYLGVSYDMPKMDQVAVPDFRAGAMENWGLVTYNSKKLLYDPWSALASSKESTAMIIAHEFAHQWFGDLVSPEWWKYLWLNEGFATYFGSFALVSRMPEWRLEENFVVRTMQTALHVDGNANLHPMTVDVSTPLEIRSIFDAISYAKSGSVVRMMESIVTAKSFRKGLTAYLKSKSHSTATPEDLFDSLSKQMAKDNVTYEVDLKAAMRTWTLQTGFPVVNVTRDYQQDEAATLSQQRFLSTPYLEEKDSSKWYVPLTHTNQAEADFESTRPKHWLDPKDLETRITNLGASTQWVLFNVKAAGFYRVNYDRRNWKLLTAFLKGPDYQTIPPANRAQLLDDAFQLALGQRLQYRVAFNLTTYLRQEIDDVVWSAVEYSLKELLRKFDNTPGYSTFIDYWLHLRHRSIETFGLVAGADDDHGTRVGRAAAAKLACELGAEDCVVLATGRVGMWMHNPDRHRIDPDLQEAFYCAAARFGDPAVADFLRQQQDECVSPWERDVVIKARGCSDDPKVLHSFLGEAIANDSSLSVKERIAVFEAVYTNPTGLDVAFSFTVDHFAEVTYSLGRKMEVLKMIYKMASLSNTLAHIQLLEKFLDLYSKEVKKFVPVVKKAIELIGNNHQWYDKVGKDICLWIEEYFAGLPTATSTWKP